MTTTSVADFSPSYEDEEKDPESGSLDIVESSLDGLTMDTTAQDSNEHKEPQSELPVSSSAPPSARRGRRAKRNELTEVKTQPVPPAPSTNSRPRRSRQTRKTMQYDELITQPQHRSATEVNHITKTKAPRSYSTEINDNGGVPVRYEISDVVWGKVSGSPWWPCLVVADPTDPQQSHTKIVGNQRPKRSYFVVFYGSTADFAWLGDSSIIYFKGVEEFTKYAQEVVDQAQTKSMKEQLTERFQLKITIGRRDDWEMAVSEANEALNQSPAQRLQEMEPKFDFYTQKIGPKGNKRKLTAPSTTSKSEDIKSLTLPDNKSLAEKAEKTFEFKDDDNDSVTDIITKPSPLHVKNSPKTVNQQSQQYPLNDNQQEAPASKRRRKLNIKPIEKSTQDSETTVTKRRNNRKNSLPTTIVGRTANGSTVSYQQRRSSVRDGLRNNNNVNSATSDSTNSTPLLSNAKSSTSRKSNEQQQKPTKSAMKKATQMSQNHSIDDQTQSSEVNPSSSAVNDFHTFQTVSPTVTKKFIARRSQLPNTVKDEPRTIQ
ncbi:unnamed protein product, partial [Didymodactylos carnosus]